MVYPILKISLFPALRKLVSEAKGLDNLPKKGNFIIIANHESYLDPLIIISYIVPIIDKKIHFLAIRDHAQRDFWRLGDVICRRWAGCIPLDISDKGRAAINEALDCLKKGKIVGMFPEGELLSKERKPRSGFLRLALESGAPIIPISLKNTSDVLPPISLVPKSLKKKIRITVGKPIKLKRSPKEVKNLGKKAESIMKKVHKMED